MFFDVLIEFALQQSQDLCDLVDDFGVVHRRSPARYEDLFIYTGTGPVQDRWAKCLNSPAADRSAASVRACCCADCSRPSRPARQLRNPKPTASDTLLLPAACR